MKTLGSTSVLLLALVLASLSAGEAQVLQPGELCSDQPDAAIATFEDANLEARIRSALSVGPQEDLTCGLVLGLTALDAQNAGIASLVGIQNLTSMMTLNLRDNEITGISALSGLTNLTDLVLWDNSITDISPLSGLTNLTRLDLDGNSSTDISPLSELTSLTYLHIGRNSITDISALRGLTSLGLLWLPNNSIIDISPLRGLTSLTELRLGANSITDIRALSGLTSLELLDLRSNSITDFQPLLDNAGPGPGGTVDLRSTGVSCADVAALEATGVSVICLPEAVPHVRTGLGIQGAPYPYGDPAALGLAQESVSSLGDLVVEWVREERIVGAEIMVLKDRRVVLHEAMGWSDQERREPMRRNSIFDIRSMTKPFTGTSILILAEEGRLDLDDPVSRYLPSFRNERSRSITLRQLLAHTSGLPNAALGPGGRASYEGLREVADAIGELGPSRPPGEAYLYSDDGFATLGAVVEEVSGMPVERFIETRILEPLGMTDTHTRFTQDAPWAERVSSWYRRSGPLWEKRWDNTRAGAPYFPGFLGLYSTVMDYAKFLVAWMDGGAAGDVRFLSEASVAEALTQSSEAAYGLSWKLWDYEAFDNLFTFAHDGVLGTVALAVPEHDLLVFYFTQSRGTDTRQEFLREALQVFVN